MSQKNPWRRIAVTAAAMLIVLLAIASYRFAASRGVFASVADKAPAICRNVAGIPDVAAMATSPAGVFVAARDGGLYLYAHSALTRLAGTPKDFHPVALAASGPGLQAVFSRADGSYAIAVFGLDGTKLSEIGRLTTDILTDPAAIASLDGSRFYLVNRHTSRSTFGRWLDDTFLIPRANVLYFDGMKFVPVAERLSGPSGIALSADGAHLYVAQGLARNIVGFERNPFMGSLDHAQLMNLSDAPGAMTAAKDGSLIVAAWQKPGTGAVYRVRLANGVMLSAELLYASARDTVTAAAEADGHLLIGSPSKLLDCAL